MPYTNSELVKDVIDADDALWSSVFISTASALVDGIPASAGLSDELLTAIETYLAAHFYALKDPQYQSKKTDRASATFQGKTGMGLDGTWWGQQAQLLDTSGTLQALGNHRVGIFFLGTEEID